VYPAYETAQELDLKRKILLGRGLPPIYDRAALSLSDADRAEKEAQGIAPHWRFRLDHDRPIEWEDGIRGHQHFNAGQLSDPVIRRADGSWLYMMPSAVDDIDIGVTQVLRGEDHVSNTALQVQIFEALDARPPAFAHEALLVGDEGKLSKRLGSMDCDALRGQGIEPDALVAMLARLGTSLPVEPIAERAVLLDTFDLGTFSRAPARFALEELERVNRGIIHQLPFAAVADRLPQGMDEAAWHAIRPNLERVDEAADWWRLVTGPITAPELSAEDRAFVAQGAGMLQWTHNPWHALTTALKAATGRKGRALFLPLRLALTGLDHGPDMGELLPLIGEEEARRRLQAAGG
jgi:glutamyl-tRNA synthetase